MIIIIDFGSQFTQLVARRIRELGVYSEIVSYKNTDKISQLLSAIDVEGIIFSGGPFSVYEENSPKFLHDIENLNVPILGICYGFQLINFMLGGEVFAAKKREYGFEKIKILSSEDTATPNPIHALIYPSEMKLQQGARSAVYITPVAVHKRRSNAAAASFPMGIDKIHSEHTVWMSHGDEVKTLSPKLKVDSTTRGGTIASFHHINKPIFGVQFHPEVEHTECGKKILQYFIENICRCKKNWNTHHQIESIVNTMQNKINFYFIDKNDADSSQAICALSGGVDSCVAAVLASKVFGDRLHCIFIDNGLLRKDEFQQNLENFKQHLNLNIKGVDASELFLSRLSGINDAEEKRKIIGKTFIDIFEKEAASIPNAKFLVQGTLYPDVVESVPIYGSSSTIKTHHNVGGLPKNMKFTLIEPLRELFKDEVRKLGRELKIPDEFLERHPFPGPGLAVRILGDVTKEKLTTLREADAILIHELKKENLYHSTWQAFVVLLPIYTVGVMGDARTYENVIAIRCVSSIDGMTADWSRLPHEFLAGVSSRITNEVKGINRVVYDISSKPPATIEWE